MALLSETLRLVIEGDADGAVKAFKKTGDAADRDLGKAETQAEKTSARLTKMGAASLAAGGVMVAALASTIKPASDLNEAINVVGLTFGDSADEIVAWGKSAASSTGLAADAALSGAAAIGGLLQNVGFMQDESVDLSRNLVTLAADMGSAFNMSTVDALEAIRSGLAGEAEPLKRFNVFLSEAAVNAKALELGLTDGTGALDEHEKAQARLAIIMEQTSKIQGDFANTNGDAANAAKVAAAEFTNMKAALGTELLPIVTEVLGAINGLLGAFNGLPGPIKSVIGQAAILTTGMLLFGGSALTAAGRVKNLADALKTATGSWKGAAAAGGALTLIVLAANKAWADHSRRVEESKNRIEGMTNALQETSGPANAALQWLREYASENSEFGTLLSGLTGSEIREYANSIAGIGELSGGTADKLGDLYGSNVMLGVVTKQLTEEFEKANEEFANNQIISNNLNDAVGSLGSTYGDLYREAANAAGATDEFGGSMGRVYSPAKELRDVMDEVNAQLDDYFGTIQSELELQADFGQAIDDAVEALKGSRGSLDADTQAGRDNIAARGDLIGSIEDTVDSMVIQGETTDEIIGKVEAMIEDFKDQAREAGVSEKAIDNYTEALDEIPSEVETRLIQSGYDEVSRNAEYLRSLFDSMDGRQVTTYFVSVGGTGGTVQTNSGATDAEMDGDPNTTADDPDGDGEPGVQRSKRRMGRANATDVTVIVEMDGREVARTVERVSERDGGLRVKVRGGQ